MGATKFRCAIPRVQRPDQPWRSMKLLSPFMTLCTVAAIMPVAHAQSFPAKPVQVISAASLGSAGDIAIRLLSAEISTKIGQQLVVETRSGGAGAISANAVARAAPDGYTILYATPNILVLNRYTLKNPAYDSLRDFSPIAPSISIAIFLAVSADVPVRSVSELIEFAKRSPGKLAHGSTGIGAPTHLLAESLKIRAGLDMLHVPYTASGGAVTVMNDVATGRIQMYFPTFFAIRQYLVPNEKVKVLAVFDTARYRQAPNVPAITEFLPGFESVPAYYGLLGPLALPRPVIDRLNVESTRAVQSPTVAAKLNDLGVTPLSGSPEEFVAMLRKDSELVGKLVSILGLKPE